MNNQLHYQKVLGGIQKIKEIAKILIFEKLKEKLNSIKPGN